MFERFPTMLARVHVEEAIQEQMGGSFLLLYTFIVQYV